VFLVHGQDESAKQTTARFLERVGAVPIILHEQASRGGTIMEKLEQHSDVGFAVVLLTPDDVGRSKVDTTLRDRARQNVILELGFFVGSLGRKHVCALHKGEIELPSDFVGVVFVQMDERGAWKIELARELSSAGLSINAAAII
jgi:predicted nucleotide-binding protein